MNLSYTMNLPGQLYEAVQDLRELPQNDAQEREQHLRGKYCKYSTPCWLRDPPVYCVRVDYGAGQG